jgi:biopolymer transport protein TolR
MGAKLGGGGGRRRSNRRPRQIMSDINVTPLVDVMLVLLIVFMVTAPLLTAGVNINLPKAQARALHQQDNAPLQIGLDANGNIFVGQTQVDEARLQTMLTAIARENPDKRVYVRADHALAYGKVMQVMGIASVAGFSKIALITDPSTAQGQ